MKINWKCPECEGKRGIEEIQINVVTSASLLEVHEDGDAEFVNTSWDGGEVDRFQCMDCGCAIRHSVAELEGQPIKDYQYLFVWLRNHGMLEDDDV